MDPDMTISANSVQMLARIGAEHGLEPSHLLMRAGVDGEVLTDPRAEVTIRQEYAVIRALLAGCGHPPGFGVEVGMRYHLAMHGIWGLLMATSRDLREVIAIVGRYLGLAWVFTPITLEDELEENNIAMLAVDDGQVPPDVRVFLIERIAGAAQVILGELLGEHNPRAKDGRSRAGFRGDLGDDATTTGPMRRCASGHGALSPNSSQERRRNTLLTPSTPLGASAGRFT